MLMKKCYEQDIDPRSQVAQRWPGLFGQPEAILK